MRGVFGENGIRQGITKRVGLLCALTATLALGGCVTTGTGSTVITDLFGVDDGKVERQNYPNGNTVFGVAFHKRSNCRALPEADAVDDDTGLMVTFHCVPDNKGLKPKERLKPFDKPYLLTWAGTTHAVDGAIPAKKGFTVATGGSNGWITMFPGASGYTLVIKYDNSDSRYVVVRSKDAQAASAVMKVERDKFTAYDGGALAKAAKTPADLSAFIGTVSSFAKVKTDFADVLSRQRFTTSSETIEFLKSISASTKPRIGISEVLSSPDPDRVMAYLLANQSRFDLGFRPQYAWTELASAALSDYRKNKITGRLGVVDSILQRAKTGADGVNGVDIERWAIEKLGSSRFYTASCSKTGERQKQEEVHNLLGMKTGYLTRLHLDMSCTAQVARNAPFRPSFPHKVGFSIEANRDGVSNNTEGKSGWEDSASASVVVPPGGEAGFKLTPAIQISRSSKGVMFQHHEATKEYELRLAATSVNDAKAGTTGKVSLAVSAQILAADPPATAWTNLDGQFVGDKALTAYNRDKDDRIRTVPDYQSPPRSSGSSGSSSGNCDDTRSTCLGYCKVTKSDEGRGFFSSSDRERCEGYCYMAKNYCDKSDACRENQNICLAKCEGRRKDNGGFFTSSEKEKCTSNCFVTHACG
ncbi:hypothetical protein WV31_09695 [Magnetospirillum sp. ME-1]|uniref:hypothetical protein n=1 Tax=Magnetospirillum sp. ME-1 TaxID=1639348 RepID=UPI000A17CA68|nr:hypothetical protein [Magnetospirillum sp. ME-1]ARJ65910.1 hypothetical protein WV31_09695 [Magnetospirillum sp. ME-1]